jgi:membrane protein DedA with SNARE-associated domain
MVGSLVEFTRDHAAWSPLIAFSVAFAESFAFLSLLVPGWAILIGIGALIGIGGLHLWPTWAGAFAGAALGDWISFEIGFRLKDGAVQLWPLRQHPAQVVRAHAFFARWGAGAVFVGRFFGPLRAVVPLIAGVLGMRRATFQIANLTSAAAWAFVLLAPVADLLRHIFPG